MLHSDAVTKPKPDARKTSRRSNSTWSDRPSVRRSRAIRPAGASINLLEARALLTTIFVGPQAYVASIGAHPSVSAANAIVVEDPTDDPGIDSSDPTYYQGYTQQPDGSYEPTDAAGGKQPTQDQQKLADAISQGHAWDKHRTEFPGVKTQADLAKKIGLAIANASDHKDLLDGREIWYDKSNGTIVIHDPNSVDQGTALRPKNPKAYYDRQD